MEITINNRTWNLDSTLSPLTARRESAGGGYVAEAFFDETDLIVEIETPGGAFTGARVPLAVLFELLQSAGYTVTATTPVQNTDEA